MQTIIKQMIEIISINFVIYLLLSRGTKHQGKENITKIKYLPSLASEAMGISEKSDRIMP